MTSHRRPITFYIPALNGGGAQKVVVNLVNALVHLTKRPVHIVLSRREGEFLEEVDPEVRIVNLDRGRASRSIFALARYLREVRPAVLCSSMHYANVCAVIAWHIAGRPSRLVLREDNVVQVPRGRFGQRIRMHTLQGLMRWLYPISDCVVAIGKSVYNTLLERRICSPELIKLIHNPVAVRHYRDSGLGESRSGNLVDGKYIVAIGRLTEQKGFDILLDAFARLHNTGISLVILGEGTLRDALEEKARQLGVADRVLFPGFVSEPESIVAGAELFVMSSRWEGFPVVLMEALAIGTPIVATDCPGGPSEILRNGKLGHLVPVEDPDALANAISDALVAPRASMTERQSRGGDFAAPVIAGQYLIEAFELRRDIE